MPEIIRTFQGRIGENAALDAMGKLMGRLARGLYGRLAAGDADMNAIKRDFIARHGITARHFNALRIQIEGMIAGVRALLTTQIEETERRIASQDAKIKKLQAKVAKAKDAAGRSKINGEIHQRKRRRAILDHRIATFRDRLTRPVPGVCFGSRKLFRAQFCLGENGYDTHSSWLEDWMAARASNILWVGSKDETAGNQTCQGRVEADRSISVKRRLPDAMASFGKHIRVEGLRFSYGHNQVHAALSAAGERGQGDAVTWRFVRDEKDWRVFVSITETHDLRCGDVALGALGVDVNTDCLAISVADRNGNPIAFRRIDTPIIGTSAERRKAIYGDAAKAIVDTALARDVPIVVERLDFKRKKSERETSTNPRQARMLSGLADAQALAMIRSRAARLGVRMIEINPTDTSLIGDTKFAGRYGVSVHLSAALAIARRGMGLSERVPCQPSITLGGGVRGTLPQPARMGRRHVWASWARLAHSRKAALAGHSGSARRRSSNARPRGPALEGSLEQDRLFLDQLLNPGSAGAIPAAKTSPERLGRRAERIATYG